MNKSAFRKLYWVLATALIFIHVPFVFGNIETAAHPMANINSKTSNTRISLSRNDAKGFTSGIYDSLRLASLGLTRQAYDYAMKGFSYLLSAGKLNNDKIISIVDFSLPSSKKRLFILDLENCRMLFNTYVAHGRNSGKDKATAFSNKGESFQSSLGFYITQDTYTGKHGYSLHLEGEERGFNDNARNREIVMHSAPYVNESLIHSQGYIGRSLGCPAVPENLHKSIIEKIKNGSCLFMYSPDKYYAAHSALLQSVS